jgi:hypothetical protein
MSRTHFNTACTKMIGAVSSGHNGFGNARRSMFPPWNKTADIQVLISCAIPLPSLSLSVRDVTKRKWRLRSRKRFVCRRLQSMNQLFLFSGPCGDNFRVISRLPTALGVGISSSFRQRGAFVKGKVQHVRVCQKKVWNEWDSSKKSVGHASRELEMSTMTVWRVLRKRLEMKPYRLHLIQFLQSFWYTYMYDDPNRKTTEQAGLEATR